MTLDLDGALWRFAVSFFGRPDVSEACLDLQDRAGLDIVLLLSVIYADRMLTRPLSLAQIAELGEATLRWRKDVVRPLRDLRRFLKPPRAGFPEERLLLRDQIKAAELKAEQIQLAMLETWLASASPQDGAPPEQALNRLTAAPPDATETDRRSIARSRHIVLASWRDAAFPDQTATPI